MDTHGISKTAHVSASLLHLIISNYLCTTIGRVIHVQIRFLQPTRLTIVPTSLTHPPPVLPLAPDFLGKGWNPFDSQPASEETWQLWPNLHSCHSVPWYPPSSGAPRCPASMLVPPRPAAPHRRCMFCNLFSNFFFTLTFSSLLFLFQYGVTVSRKRKKNCQQRKPHLWEDQRHHEPGAIHWRAQPNRTLPEPLAGRQNLRLQLGTKDNMLQENEEDDLHRPKVHITLHKIRSFKWYCENMGTLNYIRNLAQCHDLLENTSWKKHLHSSNLLCGSPARVLSWCVYQQQYICEGS